CATGEEAYSVAMMLLEYAEHLASPPAIQIFATDIDEAAIRTAREGSYTETIEVDVSPERLRRFFTKEVGGYRVKKEVRERVLFAVHNLVKDPPFSRLDAVTCRNLLIYLNRETQEHVLELFQYVLRPNGFLFLGNLESADGATNLFATVDKKQRIYRAESITRAAARVPSLPLSLPLPRGFASTPEGVRERQKISFGELHQNLLEQYAPPSVIINAAYDIVHLSDRAGRFLQFAGGEPSHNLLKVVHPELRIELRTELFQAAQTGKSIEARRVQIKRDGQGFYVNMIARSLSDDGMGAAHNYFLVLFDEIEGLTGAESVVEHTGATEPVMRLLEEELQRTKEGYQAIIEQFETQAEELKASNEELQSMNEEMRSASEELETGKEELQSVNEEIQTVNSELKNKLDELAVANSDLQNLITSTDLATIFVDRDLNIKFYTPRAEDIFSLIPSDVGRALSDITHRLDYADLLQDVGRVLGDMHKTEREVASRDGRWYVAQMIPYRATEDRADGVILTFVDFTRRKGAENETQKAKEGLERHTVALMETNSALQAEVRERQLAEHERGQLLRRIVFAQEDERRRIAREMHDQFGQQLTALKLKLEKLQKDCGEQTKLCEQIEALQVIAEQLDADVGYLVWEMRPSALDDLGLEAALSSYVRNWPQHFGVPVQLHASGMDKERLTPELETTLYRIAQEALNNVAKHSQAAGVAVMLERRAGQVSLIIEDDGVGFDLQQTFGTDGKGLGLIGMRERAALVGGTVEIESQPDGGATVIVRIAAPPALGIGEADE
ncbi:MAG: PAS domain-containing protein, partial [Acidobacteriota bacterium]|nr:PAS domain-containing protein [Acidobacteriota bacterium]